MPSSDLIRAARRALAHLQETEGRTGTMGLADGSLYYTDAIAGTHHNKVWVTLDDGSGPVAALCETMMPQWGLNVRVGDRGGISMILGPHQPKARQFTGGRSFNVPRHAELHQSTGPDPLYLAGQQLLPLMATPTTPASMAVTVYRAKYRYNGTEKIFDTADSADLGSYIPGDDTTQHFVILCLDRANNVLVVVDGDDVAGAGRSAFGQTTKYDNPITTSDIDAISIASAYYPICAIRFYYGQPTIGPYDIFADLRLWGGEVLGTGGVARPLALDASTQLTISSGTVTVTTDYHTLAAETGTTDTLDTITAASARQLLLIMASSGDTITVSHETGNISLNDGENIALSGDIGLLLFWDGAAWTDVAVAPAGVSELNDLSDTTVTGAAQGDILRRNNTDFNNVNIGEDEIVLRLAGEDVKGGTPAEALTLLGLDTVGDVSLIFSQIVDATVANTTDETSLIGPGRGNSALEAGALAIGSAVRLRLRGYLSDTGTPTLNLKVKIGGSEVCSTGAVTLNGSLSDDQWSLDVMVVCRATGASGSVVASGQLSHDDGTTFGLTKTSATTVDTTGALDIEVTATWGTAAAGNTIASQIGIIELIMASDELAPAAPSGVTATQL